MARARKIQKFLSQPFNVAEAFTGRKGKYVKVADTVRSFKEVVEGKHDEIPEQAFYMQGSIDDVLEACGEDEEGVARPWRTRFEIEIATPEKLVLRPAGGIRADSGQGRLYGHPAGPRRAAERTGRGRAFDHLGRPDARAHSITGGYVEVRDNHVRVLADRAE